LRKAIICIVMSVLLFARDNLASTGWLLIKAEIWILFETPYSKFKFNEILIWRTCILHKDPSTYISRANPLTMKNDSTKSCREIQITHFIGKGMQSDTTVSIMVYLMAILDSYMFRPVLAIFRLSSGELKTLLHTLCAHVVQRSLQNLHTSNLTLATRPYRASSHSIPPHIEITLRNKARM
jgi:hypothetical protein